jgi:taurine transport system substrate-binding protein
MKQALKIGLRTLIAAPLLAGLTLSAQSAEKVTIAYQTTVEPSKVAQADGAYEKATGWSIDWRKFDTGAEAIAAVASGDVPIGYVGSSPLAAAASHQLPIETFFIAVQIGASEALVARDKAGIAQPQDLVGKKIAVPFVSTTHYSLLAALKHWEINPKDVQILNLRPPEISAAWERGDIDAAYVWDPALGTLKASGQVLTDSAQVAQWGAPTFDAWIVRRDFAEKHPEFVQEFARVTADAYAAYRANPNAWGVKSPQAAKIAKLTGANLDEIPALLAGSTFPLAKEQVGAALLGGGTVKAIADTAAFLKEQGKVENVLDDYSGYVNPQFIKAAQTQAKL